MDTEEVVVSRRERFSSEGGKKGGNKALPIIIGIIVLVIIGVVVFMVMNKKPGASANSNENTSPTEAPTEAPAPTEEVVVEVGKYNLQVLNGTETAGEAGKLKTTLTTAGYKVIATGNADKTTYTKTIIQAKSKVEASYVEKLKSLLEGTYPVGSSEELADDNTNDVVIIIGMEPKDTPTPGAEKKETTAPEATKTPTETPKPSETPKP